MTNARLDKDLAAIVTGPIFIDAIASGFPSFGEHAEDDNSFGSKFSIGAGGKARNIALMLAMLLGPGRVALSGRVCRDPFQLWKMIIQPLEEAGVVTDSLHMVTYMPGHVEPAVVLILVDETGHSKYFAINALNEQFSAEDVDHAAGHFEAASRNLGLVVISLGQPLRTVLHTVQKAKELNLRVVLDPGAFNFKYDHSELLRQRFFLVKPNIQEAEFLTGMRIAGLDDARIAARKLHATLAENVLLSLGEQGLLLVNESGEMHIKVPDMLAKPAVDATGCGDQLVAAVCASLIDGKSIELAAQLGVIAGALQAQRPGVAPVTRSKLD